VLVDQGDRGHGPVGGAAVMLPVKKVPPSADALRRHQTLCKRRSAIAAIIGHLKSDHRMGRNYLKGRAGDTHHPLPIDRYGVQLDAATQRMGRLFFGRYALGLFLAHSEQTIAPCSKRYRPLR
jgi:hypothetical protein